MYFNNISDYNSSKSMADFGAQKVLGAPCLTHYINHGVQTDRFCLRNKKNKSKNNIARVVKGVLCAGAAIGSFLILKKGFSNLSSKFSRFKGNVGSHVRKIKNIFKFGGSGS